VRHVMHVGKEEMCSAFSRKIERSGIFCRPKHGWEDSIKMNLKEIECDGVDWISISEDLEQLCCNCNKGSGSCALASSFWII
jgi:hypothetical protein